jgi:CRP-like cAMP-binding protein
MDASRLEGIPLFDSLSAKERRLVAQLADEIDLPEGKHVTEQGHFSHEFMIISAGTADVLEDGVKVNEMGPGDFFGEIGLLRDGRRTATVIATSPMQLIVLGHREFNSLTHEMKAVCDQLAAAAKVRMRECRINPAD